MAETLVAEKAEFDGCGLEMPDLGDEANFRYFLNWNGELRIVQNITSSSGDTEEKSWRENPWSLSHNAREILFFQNFVAEMGFLNRKEVIEKNDLIISPRA